MQRRFTFWLVGLTFLALALLVGQVVLTLSYAGSQDAVLRGPIMLYALGAGLLFIGAVVLLNLTARRTLLHPLGSVARDVRTLLQTKQVDRSLRVPPHHGLGDLPEAIATLVDELRRSRREAVRAMATATARVEQEKGWLEVILLELIREGVVVCNMEHRVLLYNQPVARLFRYSHALGLGRSLLDVVAEEPVQHALERLEFRLKEGRRDLHAPFVCATSDATHLLQARMALILDQAGKPNGYVMTLEDISAQLEDLQRNEAIRRAVTRELRGPLGSLRAAAETLHEYQDIEDDQRRAFQQVILNESTLLSRRIEALAEEYRGRSVGHWPMTEIHSPDLFNCLARYFRDRGDCTVTPAGQPQWLKGDSHSLMQVLISFMERIADHDGATDFEVEAGLGRTRTYLEVRWPGRPVSSTLLNEWLAAPLPAIPGSTAQDVLERHGAEPWSQRLPDGRAAFRIPMQPPAAPQPQVEEGELPPRPEFYDFDLMFAHSFTGDMAERPLRDLTYVVFDTETTGLRPAGGDEIISIAAARVTKGRVLGGETFAQLVNPGRTIPKDSIRFHGITDDQVKDQPGIGKVLPRFHQFAGDAVLVAHNAAFDMKFLKLKEAQVGVEFRNPVIDTLLLSLLLEGEDEDHSLDGICERLNIHIEERHTALGDALATAHVLAHFLDRLEAQGLHTFGQVMKASNMEAAIHFRAAQF